MTQRKHTETIRKTLSLLNTMIAGGEPHSKQSTEMLAEARKALGKLEDPWFYVQDGELPELNRKISHQEYASERVLVKLKEKYTAEQVGIYRAFMDIDSQEWIYQFLLTDIQDSEIEVDTDRVKCYQYIEEPQK